MAKTPPEPYFYRVELRNGLGKPRSGAQWRINRRMSEDEVLDYAESLIRPVVAPQPGDTLEIVAEPPAP